LTEDGLVSTVRAANVGGVPAPYGVCPHPYLVAGPSGLDEWSLELPAADFLEVTQDRLLPVGMRSVDGHEFDFRAARRLGAVKIDHALPASTAGLTGAHASASRIPQEPASSWNGAPSGPGSRSTRLTSRWDRTAWAWQLSR
jgi:galactose mutarotase-like enzyme